MSTNVGALRFRVRERLRLTDDRRVIFDTIEIDEAIADAYLFCGASLPPAHLYTANAFTIAAGSETFTLPATVPAGYISNAEYAGALQIQKAGDGLFLSKRSMEEMDALRDGQIALTGSIPTDYALREDYAQAVQGYCFPRAASAESCHLFRRLVVDDLRDHATDLEAATIGFSRYAAQALALYAAVDLLGRMTADDLALCRLDRGAGALWMAEAQQMLYREEVRRNELEGDGHLQRWVG